MSVSVDSNNRSEEIGKILAKVQDDLQYLKAAASHVNEGHIDSDALDLAISRTERDVQAVAERVLATSNNHVVTLPAVSRRPAAVGRNGKPIEELVNTTNRRSPIKEARLAAGKKKNQMGLSPGQQVQIEHVSQLMARPTNPLTRQMLNSHYGLPTSKGQTSKEASSVPGQVITGTTIEPLSSLPRANRRSALMTPPPISETDARKGLLSLLERGLIPPAADIVLSPPPVQPRPVPLHHMEEQHLRTKVAMGGDSNLTGVKLDPNPLEDRGTNSIYLPAVNKSALSSFSNASKVQGVGNTSVQNLVLPISPVIQRPQTPPATPTNRKDSNTYKVVIQNGSVVDGVKEFALFKKTFRAKWPHIKTVLNCVEEFCRNYAIPLAMLDGGKISELAFECELGLRPSKQNILDNLLNKEEVQKTIAIPGRRFKGHRGIHAAASKIQATYRMYMRRREYLEYRRKKWAAGVVSLSWLLFAKVYKIRAQLKESRARQLDNHHKRAAMLRRRWAGMNKTRRTVVHIPSLGYSSTVRNGLEDFKTSQALQLARLCDIRDPNVDVIYISPIPVDQGVLDYYHQLLSMGPAVQGAKDRVHIITPENMDSFGHHHLSLTTLLLYSPRACERIWNLIKGKEAYIVPGVVSRDDITLADKLGLPILGPDHEITQLYSTRSGHKRIFNDACVATPPSEGDIFSTEQLVEKLASLTVNHPLVTRWLFKLPDYVRGKGFAYCDVVQHLECHAWLLKEAQRYGEKWTKKWAQEYALKRVLSELPSILSCHAHPLDSSLFPTWDEFLTHFISEGGLIEGTPPSESVTSISVDLFIEPTGAVNVVSMRDQILSSPYTVWGSSLPQCSVPPELLISSALKVGSECKARGVVGYFTIDYVTFIDPKTFEQQLWAVDLDLGYSDHLALQDLVTYVTGAKVETETSQLLVQREGKMERRCAVLSPHLMHTNLSLIYYPIFFQMCKAHFIGFNQEEKEGTVFALVDGHHRERLGMACVQPSLLKALRSCSSNLSTIHQEVSTPHMQGMSNFQSASREIDSIAELMDYNETHTS